MILRKCDDRSCPPFERLGWEKWNWPNPRCTRNSRALIDEVEKMEGRSFYPNNEVSYLFSNIACSIIFGHRFDYDDPNFQRINNSIRNIVHNDPFILDIIPMARFLPKVKKQISCFLENQKSLFETTDMEIAACLRNSSEESFVKSFLEAVGEKCNRENLHYILRDLLIGATDTSLNLLLWGMIILANNPDIQNNIRLEISSNVPKSRLPSLDDKPNLPYTEASIIHCWVDASETHFPVVGSIHDSEQFRSQRMFHSSWNTSECFFKSLQ